MIIELVQNSKHANLLNENEVEIAVTIDGAYTRIFDVYGKPAGRGPENLGGKFVYSLHHGIKDFDEINKCHVVIDGYSYRAVIRMVCQNHVVAFVNGKNVIVKKTNTFR